MPKDPNRRELNPSRAAAPKTFRVSLWVIAAVALIQVAAIAFAVVRDDLGNRDLASRRPLGPSPFALVNSTSVPAGFPEIDRMFDSQGWEPVAAPQAPNIERTTAPSLITDPMVRDKMEFARLLREEGDIQTALEQFRSANKMQPNTPEILYEIASSCNTLDLPDEASDAWMEIRNLGPQRGGEFYKLAEIALLGRDPDGSAVRTVISLSNHHLFKNPQETSGEMLTLRTSIKARDGIVIDPEAVQLRVLFFDLVNGRTIARGLNNGNYPRRGVTLPLDWAESPREEIFDFAYYRPYAQDEANGEQRQFYGFVAQLWYENEWQDLVSSPSTLVAEMKSADDLAPPMLNAPRVENSLFPKP